MARSVYLGTSEFAATVLSRLAKSPHRPLLVIAPPDRRRGRGKKLHPPPVAALASRLDLPLLQTENVNEELVAERIAAAEPDALAVCAFGQIIREPLLSLAPLLNVHPSLLPRWRGAAPIERAIMAGDETTGVCIMRLTAGLDEGPVALREETPIAEDEDFGSLSARLATVGGELLARAFDLLDARELAFSEQDPAGVTYAEKIEREERRLDPARSALELGRTVRGLSPHVGAYLELPGSERLGVRQATPVDMGVPAGAIAAEDETLLLGCAEGSLRLDVVQPPGGRPLPAADYLRGRTPPTRAV